VVRVADLVHLEGTSEGGDAFGFQDLRDGVRVHHTELVLGDGLFEELAHIIKASLTHELDHQLGGVGLAGGIAAVLCGVSGAHVVRRFGGMWAWMLD
jgi:plasmid replication initiation protein